MLHSSIDRAAGAFNQASQRQKGVWIWDSLRAYLLLFLAHTIPCCWRVTTQLSEDKKAAKNRWKIILVKINNG